jgi:hypothetical protein
MNLCSLPLEILSQVMVRLPAKIALRVSYTCKGFYKVFGPDTLLWRMLRKAGGWPDPVSIGMSDYWLLRAIYDTGCQNCDDHPGFPIWAFAGMRLCRDCFGQLTVYDHDLQPHERVYVQLNNVPYCTDHPAAHWAHRSYLKKSISSIESETGTEAKTLNVSLIDNEALASFCVQMRHRNLQLDRNVLIAVSMQRRKKQVDQFLSRCSPRLDYKLVTQLATYNAEVKKTTMFTLRAQTIFLNRINNELLTRHGSEFKLSCV